MKRLGIIGGGDLGQLIAQHAPKSGGWTVAGFFDDTRAAGESTERGPILGGVDALDDPAWGERLDALFVAVGYKHPAFRKHCFERFSPRFPFATLVHESCYVDASSRVEPGTALLPGCVVDTGCVLGPNALLNTAVVVAHDTTVRAHSFLGPAVALAGFVTVGEGCFLGINTTVIDNVTLSDGVQTGGGAVVIDNLSEPGLYAGVPAKRVR